MYYRIYFECLLPVISQRLPYGVVNALLYALLQVCEAQGQEAVAVDEQSGVGVPLGVCLVNGARFRHIVGIGGSVHLNAGGSAGDSAWDGILHCTLDLRSGHCLCVVMIVMCSII